jgi:hypothetical protein
MDISFQSAVSNNLAAGRFPNPSLSSDGFAATLLGNNQSPFGGFDLNGLVTGLLKAFGADAGLLGAVTKELASLLSPLERGVMERLIGENMSPAKAPLAVDQGKAKPKAATIPARAADSAKVPSLEAIAKDPVVAAAINKAWTNSNPNTAGKKQETGFWVVRNDKSGKLSIVQFPSNGTRDSLTPGAPPSSPGNTTVAFFHTHPNTVKEGYVNGPSSADQNFATANNIPGIIRSHAGMYYFKP